MNQTTSKQLAAYIDRVRVFRAQYKLSRTQSDQESFRIVYEFGSNAFRNLLDRVGIDTYGKFLDANVESLGALRGVGATKIEEFKLARELFSGGSRMNIPSEPEDGAAAEAPTLFANIPRADEPVPEWRLRELGPRGLAVIKTLCPNVSVGAVAKLTRDRLPDCKNCGAKTRDAIMALAKACRDGSVWDFSGALALHAREFDSLSDMLLKTVEVSLKLDERFRTVMRMHLGLLDATESFTLEKTGIALNITRERARQLAKKIKTALVTTPLPTGLAELKAWAEGFLGEKEASDEEFVKAVAEEFHWSAPTFFSLKCALGELGVVLVVNPKTGLVAQNKDGRYDWVKTYTARQAALTRKWDASIPVTADIQSLKSELLDRPKFFPAILKFLRDGGKKTKPEIIQHLIEAFHIRKELMVIPNEDGSSHYENRMNWAISDLNLAGMIRIVECSVYEITDMGIQVSHLELEQIKSKVTACRKLKT